MQQNYSLADGFAAELQTTAAWHAAAGGLVAVGVAGVQAFINISSVDRKTLSSLFSESECCRPPA